MLYVFCYVIRQISRSLGTKNRRFWPKLSASRLLLQFEFADGYEMIHKAWFSTEQAPCCLFRSSIKFQDHMGCKIDVLNPIWVWISNYVHYKEWDEITFPSQHFIGVSFKLIHICKRSRVSLKKCFFAILWKLKFVRLYAEYSNRLILTPAES